MGLWRGIARKAFFQSFRSGINGCGDLAGCACDERKKRKRVPAGRVVRRAPGTGPAGYGRKRGPGDNDRSTPCRTFDAGTSGPLRAGARHQAYAGSAGQRDIASNGNCAGGSRGGICTAREPGLLENHHGMPRCSLLCSSDPRRTNVERTKSDSAQVPQRAALWLHQLQGCKFRTIERPATLRPGCTLEFGYGIDTRDAHNRPKNSLQLRNCIWSLCSRLSRLPADGEQLFRRSYQGLTDPIPNSALTCCRETPPDPTFGYRHQPGSSAEAGAVPGDEICDRHRRRIGYDESLSPRLGIA